MDKLLEKLAGVCEAEDLVDIQKSFESAVKEAVEAKLEEKTKELTSKFDEFCAEKVNEAVESKTKLLEDLANEWTKQRAQEIQAEADERVKELSLKLEEASEEYIKEYFNEKFTEKYGEELDSIEEKVIKGLDDYLKHNITEKIDASLIKQTALSETYSPIIEGIQSLFEDQFVPMDLTGSKKLKEMKAENAEMQKSLKKQISENMRLAEKLETSSKNAIISEKTAGLTLSDKNKVKMYFKEKSYAETSADIADFVDMLKENASSIYEQKRHLTEKRRPVSHSHRIDDETTDTINERVSSKRRQPSADEQFLLTSSRYV